MHSITPQSQYRHSHRVRLYKIVHTSQYSLALLFLLFCSFLLQPFYRAQADTTVSSPLETVEMVTDTSSQVPAAIAPPDEQPAAVPGIDVPDDTASNVDAPTPLDSQEIPLDVLSTTSVDEQVPEDVDAASDPTTTSLAVGTEREPAVASSTVLGVPSTVLATATVGMQDSLPLVHESYGDDEVIFKRESCVLVDDGSYYCQTDEPKAGGGDAVIAEPDSGGDMEIFVVKGGEYFQVTHNYVDDAAPFYDGRSKTIVWHRLLNDRYVIVSYDTQTGEEFLLTDGSYNDMEPTRFGTYTVWQRWIDGNWHIMLNDGATTLALTTAAKHHIAPQIRGDIIMWHTTGPAGAKQLEAYDIETRILRTIDESEGVAMANPRMMMVYEAVYDNGDVVMRGVDLKTGKVSVLDVVPSSVPKELPESERTGETRALIQNKSQEQDTEVVEDDTGSEPPPPLFGNATTSGLTIDLRSEVSSSSVSSEISPAPAFDLYIPPATSTQNTIE